MLRFLQELRKVRTSRRQPHALGALRLRAPGAPRCVATASV